MSSDVTREGLEGVRPGREATVGLHVGGSQGNGHRDRRRGEQPVVPKAEFRSYYGLPVLNPPVWKSLDIAGYLFLGGLSGASAVLAAGAQVTGRDALATRAKVVSTAAITLSAAALVHDLGRPSRFYNMLRVVKPSSPMSIGSWLLAAFGPASGVASLSALTGRAPRTGAAATVGAAALGPLVSTYTAALVADTSVPAWHDGHREMPFVFAASSATAAGGAGLVLAPLAQSGPARRMAVLGAAGELVAAKAMEKRMGEVAEPYHRGKGARLLRIGEALTATGVALCVLGRRRRAANVVGGAALVAASACTRFGIFHAGMQSAQDPRYTVEPQKAR